MAVAVKQGPTKRLASTPPLTRKPMNPEQALILALFLFSVPIFTAFAALWLSGEARPNSWVAFIIGYGIGFIGMIILIGLYFQLGLDQ